MKTYYTTIGKVRGTCGHMHQTREAAQRCADRDHRGCQMQGGYSDRAVVPVLSSGRTAEQIIEDLTSWGFGARQHEDRVAICDECAVGACDWYAYDLGAAEELLDDLVSAHAQSAEEETAVYDRWCRKHDAADMLA